MDVWVVVVKGWPDGECECGHGAQYDSVEVEGVYTSKQAAMDAAGISPDRPWNSTKHPWASVEIVPMKMRD